MQQQTAVKKESPSSAFSSPSSSASSPRPLASSSAASSLLLGSFGVHYSAAAATVEPALLTATASSTSTAVSAPAIAADAATPQALPFAPALDAAGSLTAQLNSSFTFAPAVSGVDTAYAAAFAQSSTPALDFASFDVTPTAANIPAGSGFPLASATAPAADFLPPVESGLDIDAFMNVPSSSNSPAVQSGQLDINMAAAAAVVASGQQGARGTTPGAPSVVPAQRKKLSGRYALTDFSIERTLGTGSFGRVHLVRSRHNGRFYAVKVLRKEQVVRMKQVEHTNSERAVLEVVRHPFLVNLWGTFSDPTFLYMVMDFVPGGELFTLLRKSQRFPHPVAKFYAAEVALAIDYLHQNGFIYRDLKPENILLSADGHLKITDFGFAKYVPDVTWTLCGTPDYLAPEIVSSKGYNKSVDWWALGVLLFEMLAGHPPFFTEDGNPMKLYEKIIACKVRYPPYFEPAAKDLLKSLLTADLTKRYGNLHRGSRDIFGHLWFAEVDWDRLYKREIPAPYLPTVGGDGDASQFERYPENDLAEYTMHEAPDVYGSLFPDF